MIIKEFRIVIPMTVEEYQIGQLYTIQKKSRIESVGAGSGVEIIENKPFEQDNEKGQYTMKVYHVDERLPSSLKTVTKLLFPKSALLFEEESWNSYPYTRTKYRHKLFKSFNIDIESKYLADCGQTENPFNLNKSELSMRQVDFIDIVNDTVNPHEYKVDEDPSLFESTINKNRGPMLPNWLTTLKTLASSQDKNKKVAFMCCYKLCRIECAFWGCQSRVEKSIADSVLRNMLLITHRQAWTWQDEYINLTMDDVRKLEAETQRYLMKKMNDDPECEITLTENKNQSIENNTKVNELKIERLEIETSKGIEANASMKKMDSDNSMKSCQSIVNEDIDEYKLNAQDELEFNLNMLGDNNDDDLIDQNMNLDANDEFYDAISQASFNLSSTVSNGDQKINSLMNIQKKKKLMNLRSLSMNSENENNDYLSSDLYGSTKSIESNESQNEQTNSFIRTQESYNSNRSFTLHKNINGTTSLVHQISDNNKMIHQKTTSTVDTLILVVHGGNITCTDTSKKSDFINFKSTMESVIKQHYYELSEQIAYRLVSCDSICKEALINLSSCNPVACVQPNSMSWEIKESDIVETCAGVFGQNENLPFSTIPLLITANQTKYRESVAKFTKDCNKVYHEFMNTCPGFQGKVVLIGDSIGALLVYDALTNLTLSNQNDSLSSTSSVSNLIKPSSASPSPILTRKNDFISINSTYSNEADTNSSNHNSASESYSSFFTPETNKTLNESTQINIEERLDFDVSHFFVFGSPLGLILTHRKLSKKNLQVPLCTQMYNMFHLTDPNAYRVEPLLCKQFSYIQPCMVPRYTKFPLGDGYNLSLDHFIVKHGNLFDLNHSNKSSNSRNIQKQVESFLTPNFDQLKSLHRIIQTKKNWWGDNRLDYVLYAPEKIANLPKNSLPYLFHSCFWESSDVSAFILRMITKQDSYHLNSESDNGTTISRQQPTNEIEKWQRKFNRVKLRNLSPNHRSNDVIVNEDKEQILSAKFSYGPLDFVLSGEKIDIYILKEENFGNSSSVSKSVTSEWDFLDTTITDTHGKVIYEIPESKRLSLGIYQIKMAVKCDHSFVEFYMAVLPADTQAVVFSIDGSFAANISFTGTDPKVRAGAVDVVRYWTDLGYLIIYVTARPDMQHYKVTNWLAQHNFPIGMVFFSNGLRHDPIKQKTETLRNLIINNKLNLSAAYGSPKDIPMYSSLGVPANRIFIIAKTKSKYLNCASVLKDGYASHLANLKSPNTDLRQATGNARLILKRVNLTTFSIKQNPIFCNTPPPPPQPQPPYKNDKSEINTPITLSPQIYSNESSSVLVSSINPSSSSGSKQLFNAFSANLNSLIDNQQNIKSKLKSHININSNNK